jgi:hypothetical protein
MAAGMAEEEKRRSEKKAQDENRSSKPSMTSGAQITAYHHRLTNTIDMHLL